MKEFASLFATQKKVLLNELQARWNEFLHPDHICATVKKYGITLAVTV